MPYGFYVELPKDLKPHPNHVLMSQAESINRPQGIGPRVGEEIRPVSQTCGVTLDVPADGGVVIPEA